MTQSPTFRKYLFINTVEVRHFPHFCLLTNYQVFQQLEHIPTQILQVTVESTNTAHICLELNKENSW